MRDGDVRKESGMKKRNLRVTELHINMAWVPYRNQGLEKVLKGKETRK